MKFFRACLFLALCSCAKERTDPWLAEVTSPLHATVRVIDVAVPRTCPDTPLTERLTCQLSRPERQGCVYLEVSQAADQPVKALVADPVRCKLMKIGLAGERVLLQNAPGRRATLYVDTQGQRVVAALPDSLTIVFVRNGRIVLHRKLWSEPGETPPPGLVYADGTLDWSLIPPMLGILDASSLASLTEMELDEHLAQTPDGLAVLKQSLLNSTDSPESATWTAALSRLEAPDRAEVRNALLLGVSTGTSGPLRWFLEHPEEQGPDFVKALEDGMHAEGTDRGLALKALARLAPERASTLACALLEESWSELRETSSLVGPPAAALAVIASLGTKCEWVMPLLERVPCAQVLRCDPQTPDGAQTPLCTSAQSQPAVARAFRNDPNEYLESDWGLLLLAAAQVQGPLPAAVKAVNERRFYRRSATLQGEEGDDPCHQLEEEPGDWACRLPLSVTTSTQHRCRLVLDDAKKTMTLSPVR